MRYAFVLPFLRFSAGLWIGGGLGSASLNAAFAPGDLLRTTKKETLQFLGEPFLAAPKGQEFILLEHQVAQKVVNLAFVQKEGGVIAVTLPDSSVELTPLDGWGSLLRGTQLFHDQRFDDARKLVLQSASESDYRPLATRILPVLDGVLQAARPAYQILSQAQSAGGSGAGIALASKLGAAQTAFVGNVRKLHELAGELDKQGYTSLAFFLDEGAQRLATRLIPVGFALNGAEIPHPAYSRQDLAARASKATFSVVRCRQAMAVRRMMEASQYAEEGLKAEPARPDLLKMRSKITADIQDAEGRADAAEQNRKRNLAQALLALERGFKDCADLPRLLKLREDMSGALEQKTAPPVTPEFLAAARSTVAPAVLEQGHQLYTTRCAQCHELEMLDSRSLSGWKNEVAGMAGRAKINGVQQSAIVDYIAAAMNTLEKR